MGRLLAVALGVVLATGSAFAGPSRKVAITTDPPGATVWLNDNERDPVCQAPPATVDAPLGETPLHIELAGYAPEITVLEVARGAKTLQVPPFTLEASSGFLDVQYKGDVTATIKVDGKKQGTAPAKLTLDPGTHKVVVTANGNPIFEKNLDIEAGKTVSITPTAPDLPPGPPPPDPPDGGDKPPGDDIVKTAPEKPRKRIITGSALFDVGFRQFSYSNPVAPASPKPNNVGADSEKGQLMAGVYVEFWPSEAFDVAEIKDLSLIGRFEFGLNQQAVNDPDLSAATTTFWQSIEVAARYRINLADGAFAIEPSAGYTRDRFQFNGADMDIALVPDADHQAVKIGARGILPMGSVEPYVDLQNRIVVNGGDMQGRFTQASANGLHAAVGLAIASGNLSGRVEAALTRYSWSFSNNGVAMPTYTANGAIDMIEQIVVSFGYSY